MDPKIFCKIASCKFQLKYHFKPGKKKKKSFWQKQTSGDKWQKTVLKITKKKKDKERKKKRKEMAAEIATGCAKLIFLSVYPTFIPLIPYTVHGLFSLLKMVDQYIPVMYI